jgi:Protein of unknown function (DUF3108)
MVLKSPIRLGIVWLAGAATTIAGNERATAPAHGPGAHGTYAVTHSGVLRVGERLTYDAHINRISVGSATLNVAGLETLRGHTVYHTVFDARARLLWYHARNHTESWFDTTTLNSLRLSKVIAAGAEDDTAAYEFYGDSGVYTYIRNGESKPSVADPVDEGSLLYYVRTLALAPSDLYTINRFYRRDKNPIVIKVLRRERVTVPAGAFDAIVVSVAVKSDGLLSEKSDAEIWLSDDSSRLLLRLRSRVRLGTLQLDLKRSDEASSGDR